MQSLQQALATSASISAQTEGKLQEKAQALEAELTRVRLNNHHLKEGQLEEAARSAAEALQKREAFPSRNVAFLTGLSFPCVMM